MKKIVLISALFLTVSGGIFAQKSTKTKKTTEKAPIEVVKTNRMVLISTDFGDMKILLYDATPMHRDNFVKLAGEGFYDSLLFHRVIRNFMIQGGDPESKFAPPEIMLGNGDVGYTIPAEFVDTLIHKKGVICAARTENPEKASSGCQFYIVQGQVLTLEQLNMFEMQQGVKLSSQQRLAYSTIGGSPWLDHAYTIFGEIVEGLDVLDKIAAAQTAPGDRPVTDIRMKIKVVR